MCSRCCLQDVAGDPPTSGERITIRPESGGVCFQDVAGALDIISWCSAEHFLENVLFFVIFMLTPTSDY